MRTILFALSLSILLISCEKSDITINKDGTIEFDTSLVECKKERILGIIETGKIKCKIKTNQKDKQLIIKGGYPPSFLFFYC